MLLFRLLIFATLLAATSLRAESPAEQKIIEAIKSPDLSVVHLWAPWCSNCQAELKSGGWVKKGKEKTQGKFYFVSILNEGGGGPSILQKIPINGQTNGTNLADPG